MVWLEFDNDSEAEAIFRKESFPEGLQFESSKYYTKIKGVRVPIDVFGYKGKGKVIAEPVGKGIDPLTRRAYRTGPEILSSRARSPYPYSFYGRISIQTDNQNIT